MGDRERLFGFLEGGGKMILSEPQALLTEASKMPGLDGQKMSKSYNNTITLREDAESVTKKIRTMPTDPARVGAPIPAIRKNARCGNSTRSIPTTPPGTGCRRAAAARASAAWNASSR